MAELFRPVRIRNNGDTDYTDKWDGTVYTVPAGSETLVPFAGVCLWLGDPRMKDIGPGTQNRFRTDEYNRVKYRCGYGMDSREDFDAGRPDLEVFHPDSGERILMVVDDPEGTGVDVFRDQRVSSDTERIAQLERALVKVAQAGGDGSAMADVLTQLGVDTGSAGDPKPAKKRAARQQPPTDAPSKAKVSAS